MSKRCEYEITKVNKVGINKIRVLVVLNYGKNFFQFFFSKLLFLLYALDHCAMLC